MTVTSSLTAYDVAALLPQLKQELSIGFSEHDERLLRALNSSKLQVEAYIGGVIDEVTVTVIYPGLSEETRLPVLPLRSVTSAPIDLTIDSNGYACPSRRYGITTITYEAGFSELPATFEHAIILCAANGFDGGMRNWKTLIAAHRTSSWAG